MLPNRILHYKQGELFPFPERTPDMSSESCSETQFKTADLEYSQNSPKEGTGSGMRSSGDVGLITRISLSPCLPRDSSTLTWLSHFSSRKDLAVNFPGYHLHSILCSSAMCPGLAAAALHQEKRRHSLASKGHENALALQQKKALEVLGGRKTFCFKHSCN